MKNKLFTFTTMFFVFIFLESCNFHSSTDPNSTQKFETKNKNDFTILVGKWSDAHNTKDVGVLSDLYDQFVMYYGTLMERNECIESKLSFFKKKPDFKQTIVSDVTTENISDYEVKCSFTKNVTTNGKSTDYPSYLHFKKCGDNWKISVEGDLVTDKNLAKKKAKSSYTNSKNYYFEPSISVISGTIVSETFYGPPGYGEDPANDTKELCYVLLLDNPINVIPGPDDYDDEINNAAVNNITKIQLVNSDYFQEKYLNKLVKLTGTFFYGHSGHHHTDILLYINDAEIIQ